MMQQHRYCLLAAFIALLLYGSVGFFVRQVSAGPHIITFWRLGVGLALLSLLLLSMKKLYLLKHFSVHLISTGLLLSIVIYCYTQAVNSTTLANAAFLLYLAPVLATVLAYFVLKEKFTLLNAILLAFAFAGFMLINENTSLSFGQFNQYTWGLAAALAYAFFVILNKKIPASVPILSRTFYQLLFGFVFSLGLVDSSVIQLSLHDMAWMSLIGILHGFLAISLLIYAIRGLKTVEYGTLAYVEPLVAILIGFMAFNETISLRQLGGFSIIMACGLWLLLSKR